METPIAPTNVLSFSALLALYLLSAAGSALTFVLIMGAFQYYTYRKWWKKLIAVRDALVREYGADKVAATENLLNKNDVTKD